MNNPYVNMLVANNDETILVQTEPLLHELAVVLAVLEPRIRVRREVGVITEDVLGALVFFDLYQEALLAHIHVERVVDFAPVQIIQ